MSVNSTSALVGIAAEQAAYMNRYAVPLNFVSMGAGLISIALYLWMLFTAPLIAQRISLKLSALTAAADIMYSLFQIYSLLVTQPGIQCSLSVWGYVFFSLLSISFTVSIAFNLHYVLVQQSGKMVQTRHLFKWYVLISFALSLGISIIPFAQQMYGWDEPEEICWYRSSGERWNLEWQWLTLFGWLILGELFCIFVLISVLWHLKKTIASSTNALEPHSIGKTSHRQARSNRILRKIAFRVALYPMVPIITQTFNWLVETDAYIHRSVNFNYLLLTYICTGIQGLLNFVVLLMDPTMGSLIRATWAYKKLQSICGCLGRRKRKSATPNNMGMEKGDEEMATLSHPSRTSDSELDESDFKNTNLIAI